jgi:spore coat protein U-like protein
MKAREWGESIPWAAVLVLLIAEKSLAASSCSVVVAPPSFGNYNPSVVASLDTTGNVQVSCSGGLGRISYTIILSSGSEGSYENRKLKHLTNKLRYNLYVDGAYTQIWGDGSAGTSIVSDSYIQPGTGNTIRNYPIYGRLFSKQNVPTGTYLDGLTVTVNY